MKQTVYNFEKKKVSEVELSDEIFGVEVNEALVYEAVRMQLTNGRQGDAASKNRRLVSGSTKKIYRQKGTGRARHSDRRANIFVGGGKSFGPHPRDYSYEIPVKARRGALRSVLSDKVKNEKLLIIDNMELAEHKTSKMAKILKNLGIKTGLIVVDAKNDNLERSVRNIPHVKVIRSNSLNLVDILKHEHLLIAEPALKKVQETLKP